MPFVIFCRGVARNATILFMSNNNLQITNGKFHRRSIRLKGYDYSQAGLYFITICCQNRICRFGEIENGEMILNDFGKIAHDEWLKLPERYPKMFVDVFQIMPNHFHGIIVLENDAVAVNPVGATLAVALDTKNELSDPKNETPNTKNELSDSETGAFSVRAGASPAPTAVVMTATTPATAIHIPNTVGNIIGAYKSLVANQCLKICKLQDEYMGELWQRNYYEYIIRNDNSYQRIAKYIIHNPINWGNDKFYTKR